MDVCARAHGCEGVMEREWHEEETEEETDAKTETREEGTRRACGCAGGRRLQCGNVNREASGL